MQYREDSSKTNSGGLHTVKKASKTTQAFELRDCPERCPVRLYLLYNSLCPSDRPCDAFCLRLLVRSRLSSGTRLLLSALIRCHLLRHVCARRLVLRVSSNHSLTAIAATRLFDKTSKKGTTDPEGGAIW